VREAATASLAAYIISRDNLAKFREDKDIDRYIIFHGREYKITR
jgi:hypothetical protein